MREIKFTKMVASGNDFIVIPLSRWPVIPLKRLAKDICDRKFGIGADGLLILEKSKVADIRMRIFNVDGSEAQMCGNGARCIALYTGRKNTKIETKAGIIEAQVKGDNVRIKLTDPKDIELGVPLTVNGRKLKVNFVDSGVPHVVIFVQGLDKIDVLNIGRSIRYHKKFAPRGANVNFIEVLSADSLKIRTYERGVEDETLACGTGSVASAVIFALKSNTLNKINLHTRGQEILQVYFKKQGPKFNHVWLEGKARIICQGAYYV
ncbi:MAG: diaminopimelate epimerase [Candidatus Omnitrophica bacterium]|nr:diaminopimelate epimerase [Candidatus Omnitrophota bacterium]